MEIRKYYTAIETRLGNYLIFGGRAHLGLYSPSTWWPFPVRRALLAMEDHLFCGLSLRPGSTVLDAGCGDAQVALYLASKGLRVHAVDMLAEQVQRARSNVARCGKELAVSVATDDYHQLESVSSTSLDGVYTMESLVHARDPLAVMREFWRVLKPGGRVAFYEYDHWRACADQHVEMEVVRKYGGLTSASSGLQTMAPGDGKGPSGLAEILVCAGFADVRETDLSRNVWPLSRMLAWVLYGPAMIILALGLEQYFIGTVAVVVNYRRDWKYVAVTARKP